MDELAKRFDTVAVVACRPLKKKGNQGQVMAAIHGDSVKALGLAEIMRAKLLGAAFGHVPYTNELPEE